MQRLAPRTNQVWNWSYMAKPAVTNLIGQMECGRQKVFPITFQDLPPPSKCFQWAFSHMDMWNKPEGFWKPSTGLPDSISKEKLGSTSKENSCKCVNMSVCPLLFHGLLPVSYFHQDYLWDFTCPCTFLNLFLLFENYFNVKNFFDVDSTEDSSFKKKRNLLSCPEPGVRRGIFDVFAIAVAQKASLLFYIHYVSSCCIIAVASTNKKRHVIHSPGVFLCILSPIFPFCLFLSFSEFNLMWLACPLRDVFEGVN